MVPDPDPEQNCSSHKSGSNPFFGSGNKLRIQPNPEPLQKATFFPKYFLLLSKKGRIRILIPENKCCGAATFLGGPGS